MKIATTTTIVLTLAIALAAPAHGDGIAWEKDYASALAKAKETGKPLLVYFTGEW